MSIYSTVGSTILRRTARTSSGACHLPRWLFALTIAIVGGDALYLLTDGGKEHPLAIGAAAAAALALLLTPFLKSSAPVGAGPAPEGEVPPAGRLAIAISFEQLSGLAIFLIFLALYSVTRTSPTHFNEHVRQAYAFLHGHAWVHAPGYMEQVHWHGRTYLLHPPLSGVLLMPFVAIWGMATDQTAVAVLIGAIELALVWRLLGLMGLDVAARLWLTAFFGAGTIVWYETTLGASWGFALLASMLPTLLALNELFGKTRPWVVGVFAGAAALARYDLVLAWPLYMLMLIVRGRGWRETLWVAPGYVLAALGYLAFSEARFSQPFDIALWLWYQHDAYGHLRHPGGPFSIKNLPFNLYTVLFMPPLFSDKFPYVHPQMMGQAMVLTSPAFILALRAPLKRAITILLWLTALIAMVPALTVYANGFEQFGTRYYLQVFPFLLVLVALGVGRRADQLTKVLILMSIAMVAFGIWHIRTLGFG